MGLSQSALDLLSVACDSDESEVGVMAAFFSDSFSKVKLSQQHLIFSSSNHDESTSRLLHGHALSVGNKKNASEALAVLRNQDPISR